MQLFQRPSPGQSTIAIGAIFAATAVGLGAFAAHAMKAHYEASQLAAFETGVRYQMYHAIALIACGALQRSGMRVGIAPSALVVGIVLFSGSLYGLVLTEMKWLGPVTPIGGTAFLVGWIALAVAALGSRNADLGAT